MSEPSEEYGDGQSDTGATAQLDNEETLDGPIGADPLDAGIIPNDRPTAIDDWGTTAAEMSQGEPLDLKLAQEEPDEPETDERRAGRLVEDDEGIRADDTAQLIATDVGIDGGAASAEEAAVHIQDADIEADLDPDLAVDPEAAEIEAAADRMSGADGPVSDDVIADRAAADQER